MRVNRVQGRHLGTFEGSVGDQYQRADSTIEVTRVDAGRDPASGEQVLELAIEATEAKRACRIHLSLSETEGRRLAGAIRAEFAE